MCLGQSLPLPAPRLFAEHLSGRSSHAWPVSGRKVVKWLQSGLHTKAHIFITKMPISSQSPMFGHLLESSNRVNFAHLICNSAQ